MRSPLKFTLYYRTDYKLPLFRYFCVETTAINQSETRNIGDAKSLMECYIQQQRHDDALQIHFEYRFKGNISLNVLALKCCVALNDRERGKAILSTFHFGKIRNISILNQLLSFQCIFGNLNDAESLFNVIGDRMDTVTVTIMMKMYCHSSLHQHALDLYDATKLNLELDDYPHLWALKACEHLNDLKRGQLIHHSIYDRLRENRFLCNALINLYGRCGALEMAESVFDSVTQHSNDSMPCNLDIVTLCSMMCAQIECGHSPRALALYQSIPSSRRDSVCHELAIKAAAEMDHENGSKLQSLIFDDIPMTLRTVGITNAMLKGFKMQNAHQQTLQFYDEIDDKSKDSFSGFLAITTCIELAEYHRGSLICDALRDGKWSLDIQLMTTMIVCYGKCGQIDDALTIFQAIPHHKRSVVVMNAMMESYCDCQCSAECISLFEQIKNPDVVSFKIALKASTIGTAYHFGDSLYKKMSEKGILENGVDIGIWIHLINFYGKSGAMERCEEIWDKVDADLKAKELAIWNAMIRAFGRNGRLEDALKTQETMRKECAVALDRKTYIHLIGACDHMGDVEMAMSIWEGIESEEIKHDEVVTNSLIDCIARNGQMDKAKSLMKEHQIPSNEYITISLLSALKNHQGQTIDLEMSLDDI